MQRFVIGNWKSYKSLSDARAWLAEFAEVYQPSMDTTVIIAPSFVCLDGLAADLHSLRLENVVLAAQDVSPFPKGAYTGAVAADMIKGLARYAIVGHAERIRYFHETPQDVVSKVNEAAEAGLIPIVCIAAPSDLTQLRALQDCDCDRLLIAYCPSEVLTLRVAAAPQAVAKAVAEIRHKGFVWPVVYGGAVDSGNASQYMGLAGVFGLFVGSASLEAASFAAICRAVAGG